MLYILDLVLVLLTVTVIHLISYLEFITKNASNKPFLLGDKSVRITIREKYMVQVCEKIKTVQRMYLGRIAVMMHVAECNRNLFKTNMCIKIAPINRLLLS